MIHDLSPGRLWFIVFLCAFILYLITAQRDISWQDSGMFQWRILSADLTGSLGLALAHPLYIVLGQVLKWFSPGNLVWNINAFSGLAMAVALANVACLARVLTQRVWIALAVTAMLMVSHAVWSLSTIAEVYTLVVAGLTAELWLLTRLFRSPSSWIVVLLAFVNGLGLSVHNLALLPLPVYICSHVYLVWRKQLPAASLAYVLLAYLVGSSLYIGLVVESALATGAPVLAIQSALFGEYSTDVLNLHPGAGFWKINAALAGLSFLNVLLPLAVVGWLRLAGSVGKPVAIALYCVTALEFLFWVRYPVPDQFTFILPTLIMVAVAAAVGLRILCARPSPWRKVAIVGSVISIIGMPVIYGLLPDILSWWGSPVQRIRSLPFRDEIRYWVIPWKHHEHSARQFAEAALNEASPDGIILADETSVYPLMLQQWRDASTGGVIVQYRGKPLPSYDRDSTGFRRATANRSVFAVSPIRNYMPAGMGDLLRDAEFVLTSPGVLYRLQR
jgi:hypothetical protein